jgi:cell wall-associated NlpC family hydrolase
MATRLRLVLLVLALAYSAAFGPGGALAAHAKQHRIPRPKLPRLRHQHRAHLPRASLREEVGQRIVGYARSLLGVPYRYGGASPQAGFDCSGLVRFVYSHFGIALPHSSYADFDLGRRVPRGQLRPGDLVFFDGVGHVGMYVGGGRFIHAPHTGTSVQISRLGDSWYSGRYDGARRLAFPRRLLLRAGLDARRESLVRHRLHALRFRLG